MISLSLFAICMPPYHQYIIYVDSLNIYVTWSKYIWFSIRTGLVLSINRSLSLQLPSNHSISELKAKVDIKLLSSWDFFSRPSWYLSKPYPLTAFLDHLDTWYTWELGYKYIRMIYVMKQARVILHFATMKWISKYKHNNVHIHIDIKLKIMIYEPWWT